MTAILNSRIYLRYNIFEITSKLFSVINKYFRTRNSDSKNNEIFKECKI